MTDYRAILVVDPVSSSVHYGNAIQAKGYRAIALISVKNLPVGLRRLQNLEGFQHIIYAEDVGSVVDMLSRFKVCAVVPGSDVGICLADKISDHYGLVGNLVETSLSRTDKACQRSMLMSRGVPVGLGVEVGVGSFDYETLQSLKYPVVVKPCLGTGSKNVKVCETIDEVRESISSIRTNHEAEGDGERRVLVEEYLSGEEYFAVVANFGIAGSKQLLCFATYEKLSRQRSPSVYRNIRSLPLVIIRLILHFPMLKLSTMRSMLLGV